MSGLISTKGFWYMASPYGRHPLGTQHAYQVCVNETARLWRAGIVAFSPIVNTHPCSDHLPEWEHEDWMRLDYVMCDAACGAILLADESWEISKGMQLEFDYFRNQFKPIFPMIPGEVPPELLEYLSR